MDRQDGWGKPRKHWDFLRKKSTRQNTQKYGLKLGLNFYLKTNQKKQQYKCRSCPSHRIVSPMNVRFNAKCHLYNTKAVGFLYRHHCICGHDCVGVLSKSIIITTPKKIPAGQGGEQKTIVYPEMLMCTKTKANNIRKYNLT